MKIKYINYGIGCKVGKNIYLNKNLKNHPKLLKKILDHEKEHSDNFDLRDIIIDFQGRQLRQVKREYYIFVIKNPSSWVQFLPICFYDKKLTYDPIMIFTWICIILIIFGGIINLI